MIRFQAALLSRSGVFALLFVTALGLVGCSSDGSKDDDTDDAATGNSGTGGSGGDEAFSATATTNLGVVQENMLPGSLAISTSSLRLLEDDNPCADADGFFDCQPALLKLYMHLAKEMAGHATGTIDEFAKGLFSHIDPPTDGVEACDSVVADGEDEGEQIDYCVTSKSKFSVKMTTSVGPFIALAVDGGSYQLWVDPSADAESDDEDMGQVYLSVDYTSETAFDLDMRMVGMGCDDDDVRAPNSIGINVKRSDDVWQGKAMLYHPRWLFSDDDGITCEDDPTDDMGMTIYTDFVGNDDNTTASLFMMPVTVDDTDEIADWPASEFCSNFSGMCYNGYGFGDDNLISSYSNPYCVTEGDVSWDGSCDDDNELVATPTYTDASRFHAPSEFKDLSITFPEVNGQ